MGITPPDDLAAELENMKRLCSGELRSFTMEKRYVRKDGSIVWVTLNAAPLWRPGEEPVHHIAVVQDITQRKRTEEALRDREAAQARFKSTLDQTHDSVFMFDPDSLRFHYCNQGAVEQVGYSEAELLTMTPLDIKPEFTEQSFCEMLQLLRDGRVASHVFETVHRHKDGHDVAVEVSLQLVRQEGREGCFIAVVRDITDRRQAEEALRASEARFRMLVEATTDWMWEIDEQSRYTYCSPKIRDLLGYEPAEALGKTPFDFMPEEEARRIASLFGPIAAARQPFSGLENMNRHKDGRLVILECRGVPIIDAGVFRGYRGFDQDITERKRAEEALICSERQLRTVLDALPIGVWFTDQLGKPVLSNPAAKQIWSGIKQVGIKTAPNDAVWWEATGPSEAIHRWALSQSLTKGLSSLNETIDLEGLDGRIKTIRNTTVPVQDETGVILGAIVLNEDVTALRQMQGALKLTQSSVDHAVEGFLWVDSDARILNVNDAACRMLEYSRDELTTMTMHDIDPNVSRDLWSSYWDELKRKGSMTFESKHWSKTGRVLDTEVTVTCLEYEGKQYSCAIMRDIGERKRAETSLRQSEERYRSLVDSAPIGIFVNEDGRFAYANREMQRILNATNVEQLIGTPVLDRIAPEFQQIMKDRIHAMMSNGQPLPSLDEQFVRLDGSRVDVAVTAISTSFNGMPVMQVLVLDITERKQAEAAIRRSHAFLRQVIDIYPNFIFAKDRAGQFRLANQAVADAYGITVDQLIGKTDADFNPNPIEVEFFRLKDLEVMDSLQERVISEEAITDSAGRTRWLQTVKRPICDEEGRAIMTLGAATDITERKRMEETLRQREQDLRAAIEERERISQD
ncbi:MAG: PAS domain S-box protein, partial [Nitrospiraceae bacterium]